MGFKVTRDVEFHNGASVDEFYVRIEDYKLEKHSGMIRTFSNIFTSRDGAQKAIPEFIEDLQSNDAVVINMLVVMYFLLFLNKIK